MSNSEAPADISSTFVVANRDLHADTVAVTETIWSDLDHKFGNFAGHTLIASFSFHDDCPTWEIHPNGDEVVCLMCGDAEMILATKEGKQSSAIDCSRVIYCGAREYLAYGKGTRTHHDVVRHGWRRYRKLREAGEI